MLPVRLQSKELCRPHTVFSLTVPNYLWESMVRRQLRSAPDLGEPFQGLELVLTGFGGIRKRSLNAVRDSAAILMLDLGLSHNLLQVWLHSSHY